MRLRIERKKEDPTKLSVFLMSVFSVLISLVILGFIILSLGKNPIDAYIQLTSWPFGTIAGLTQTLISMMPLLFTSLGVLVAFKMKLWNIGAEGQFYMGAFAATWGALFLFGKISNPWLMLPLLALFAAAFGGAWGAASGWMKAKLGVNEILSTLMLNYIAIYWVNYLVYGPWKGKGSYNFPITATFPKSAILPQYTSDGLNLGIFLAVVMSFFVYYLLRRTKFGFHMDIVGDNPVAAEYAGIDVKKMTIAVLAISGAISGLGGMMQMSGVLFRLQPNFSPGYGYTAIIVAWLARLNPFVAILVAFLFGGLLVGTQQIQLFLQIPFSLVSVFEGLVLFSLISGEALLRYKISLKEVRA
jgi:ABC-type uncharacterized transport system permease subunit